MFQQNLYSDYIYISRYARYLDNEKRREVWEETVQRYFDFFQGYLLDNHDYDISSIRHELENTVLAHSVMPSMRALMTAGKALEKNHICGYNCSAAPIDSLKSFDESLAISMSGTGEGFSVESYNVKQLPELPDEFYPSESIIVFDDSRIGWAKGYREYLSILMTGQIPKYDTSKLRPKGARLKTMGGRSAGPLPLIELLEFTKNMFLKSAGRKLTTLDCHDLSCKIGDIVVSGGVRRSAKISLSDLNDTKMREAKTGNWWQTHPYRRLANNSAVYEEVPDIGEFMKEWLSLYESKSGERGIISRQAMKNVIRNSNNYRKLLGPEHRLRDIEHRWVVNPCSEIILRPYEFCNLSSVQIYEDDTVETLKEKVRIATILGTFQSCLTNFKYINKKYQKNCEDERLLGVSLNGIYGNSLTNGTGRGKEYLIGLLTELKKVAIITNKEWAEKLNINQSVAITCVKPEGTTSAFCGIPSGIHAGHSLYYIRYVRNDLKDPLVQFMKDNNFPYEIDAYDPNNVICFKFPINLSEDCVFKDDVSAIDHLELWLIYQKYWAEQKPSATISVKENEWLEVGAWVYKNFEWMSGVSFLPALENDTIYKQMPFTTCNKEEYELLLSQMPKDVDWTKLSEYELEDSTTNSKELACSAAGGCEI